MYASKHLRNDDTLPPPPPSPQTHTLHTISLLYYLVACYPDIIGRLKIVYAHSSSEYNGAMTVVQCQRRALPGWGTR